MRHRNSDKKKSAQLMFIKEKLNIVDEYIQHFLSLKSQKDKDSLVVSIETLLSQILEERQKMLYKGNITD